MTAIEGVVDSADGTEISFVRSGTGPPVIMVDPAGGYSGFDSIRGLGALLSEHFSVYTYDRRGRGRSGNAPHYEMRREIDDLAARIAHAGGSACVYGFSSGGLLALHAAAAGCAIDRLALLEPPVRAEGEPPDVEFAARIADLVSSVRRAEAVELFLSSIGVPAEMINDMGSTQWSALEAVAHTLVYDCEISNATTLHMLTSLPTPTLVLDSQGSSDDLTEGTAMLAHALPHSERQSLPGGWHGIADEDLAPVISDFFRR